MGKSLVSCFFETQCIIRLRSPDVLKYDPQRNHGEFCDFYRATL